MAHPDDFCGCGLARCLHGQIGMPSREMCLASGMMSPPPADPRDARITTLEAQLAEARAEIERLRARDVAATAYRFGNWYAVESGCAFGHWDVEFGSDESHTVTLESKDEAIAEAKRLATEAAQKLARGGM
jgi:hypothetical protein